KSLALGATSLNILVAWEVTPTQKRRPGNPRWAGRWPGHGCPQSWFSQRDGNGSPGNRGEMGTRDAEAAAAGRRAAHAREHAGLSGRIQSVALSVLSGWIESGARMDRS